MKGVILAAGFGTRLEKELTGEEDKDKPKALLEIDGKPLIEYILEGIEGLVDETYIITNNKYYTDFLDWEADWCEKNIGRGVHILNNKANSNEERLGSVGDLEYVIDNAPISDDMIVVGGDNYFDFDLRRMVDKFNQTNSSVIALYDIGLLGKAKKYGVPVLDGDRVIELIEKPKNPISTVVSTLIYVIAFQDIPLISECIDKGITDNAGDFINYLTKESFVYSVLYRGGWVDIGDSDSLERARGSLNGL